jgi:hypothetical protein
MSDDRSSLAAFAQECDDGRALGLHGADWSSDGPPPVRAAALYACGTEPAYGRLSRFRLRSLVRRAPGIAAEKPRLASGFSEGADLTWQAGLDAGDAGLRLGAATPSDGA